MKKFIFTSFCFLITTACFSEKSEENLIEEEAVEETNEESTYTGNTSTESNGGIKESRLLKYDDCGGEYCNSTVDSNSFEILSYYYSKDKNNVYRGHEKYIILEDLDAKTFEVINQDFIKDKNGVYYIWSDPLDLVILDADPSTFVKVTNLYAKDKDGVFEHPGFINGKLTLRVEGADPNTFSLIYSDIGKDATHVFKGKEIIEGADPATFGIYDAPTVYFAYDKEAVFLVRISIEKFAEIDPKTFVPLDEGEFAITGEDINHYYELRFSKWEENIGVKFEKLYIFNDSSTLLDAVNNMANKNLAYKAMRYKLLTRWEAADIANKLIMGVLEYEVR